MALGATVLALAGGILAGYPLARIRFRGSQLILAVLLITQLIPPIALAIPILMLFIAFGLRGTVPGLIVVNAAFWTPILIWLIRAAFLAVPRSIESRRGSTAPAGWRRSSGSRCRPPPRRSPLRP